MVDERRGWKERERGKEREEAKETGVREKRGECVVRTGSGKRTWRE